MSGERPVRRGLPRSGGSRKIAAGGVNLHAVVEGDGPPVVLLHGFTGSAASMAGAAAGLRDRHRVIRIDLVGHGASDAPRDVAAYRMERCVDQVATVVRALCTRPAHFIGYSMGGRVALALCAWRPELAASASLIGARAGVADPGERAARVRDDRALADRIEREGVPRFVDYWMGLPLFASQRRLGEAAFAAARETRLANRAHALANSLRGMGAGAQPPLGGDLGGVRAPVCLVVGAEDARFSAIARELARELPRSCIEVVPAAGHAAHLENPSAFLGVTRRFLAEVDAEARSQQPPPETLPAHPERNPSP
jgi:2-succinyl-6-hydroxy-2,4-cyclohexadiene-1-carboxylate synthase